MSNPGGGNAKRKNDTQMTMSDSGTEGGDVSLEMAANAPTTKFDNKPNPNENIDEMSSLLESGEKNRYTSNDNSNATATKAVSYTHLTLPTILLV